MEICAEKTKLMTNSANGIQREIEVKEQKLGTVTSFCNVCEALICKLVYLFIVFGKHGRNIDK